MAKAKTEFEKMGFTELDTEEDVASCSWWLSTGSHSLNATLTGDIHHGLGAGRIFAVTGEEGCGKSFISASLIKDASKKDVNVFIFDTESAMHKDTLRSMGITNFSKIRRQDVTTISETRSKIITVCNYYEALRKEGKEEKVLIVLDSWGQLLSDKEVNEQFDVTDKGEMGQKARQQKKASSLIMAAVRDSNAAMVVVTHCYDQPAPNPMMKPKIISGGGRGLRYMSSQLLHLKKRPSRQSSDKKVIDGAIMTAKCLKNRFVPEGTQNEFYVAFKKGLNRYFGLQEHLKDAGLLDTKSKGYYKALDEKGEQIGKPVRKAELYTASFNEQMMPRLREYLINLYKFEVEEDEFVDNSMLDYDEDEKGVDEL